MAHPDPYDPTTAPDPAAPYLLLLVGDSPRQPSGLGRIARDLGERIAGEADGWEPRVVFHQIGWEDDTHDPQYQPQWGFTPLQQIGEDWGAARVFDVARQIGESYRIPPSRTVIWLVWDPQRCYAYLRYRDEYFPDTGNPPLWGYCAIDGHNPKGQVGGPAGEFLCRADRILAYTHYGAGIITASTDRPEPVQYLPHGHYWSPGVVREYAQGPNIEPLLGCVATNQPRKDLGLFFATLANLRHEDPRWRGWLHTDRLVGGAWSLPELGDVYDIPPEALELTLTLSEAGLIHQYSRCWATLAPGRGEGFGYPIVESLACGVPVVHVRYAGGADLIPDPAWAMSYEVMDYTNAYVIGRPRVDPQEAAGTIRGLPTPADPTIRPYCQGAVAHLHWDQLWPRWRQWIRGGLR